MFGLFSSRHSRELESIVSALDKSQAVIHFGLDGTIQWANENFLNALGYRLDEIVGKHHRMFVEPSYEQSAEYRKFWEDLRRGVYQAAEYKRIGKGGKEVWIQASYNPILDASGKPFKVVKFATDITERTLKSAEEHGQVEAIGKSQAVIHFDLDGTIQWANANFLNALGYRLDEIVGKHHRMFVEPSFEQSAEYRKFWEDLRRGVYQSAEYKRIGKGGKEVWIQASYNPILDPTGKPFKVVKFATDVTDVVLKRKESERVGKLVDQNLDRIVTAVADASHQAGSAAAMSAETASTVQTVAAAAEELSSSVNEIAHSMTVSRSAVNQAIEETETADQATQNLSRTSEAMTGVVQFIQDIAGQINLLALNATIESARAGEAGKGFAVVASEVKNLATQVANATTRISTEIDSMQSVSSDVVKRLSLIKSAIESVQASVIGVASAIDEQTAVTNEISSNMQSAASAVGELNENLTHISSAIDSATGYAREGIDLYRNLQSAG